MMSFKNGKGLNLPFLLVFNCGIYCISDFILLLILCVLLLNIIVKIQYYCWVAIFFLQMA